MSKSKIERSQKAFLKAMREKFSEDPAPEKAPEKSCGQYARCVGCTLCTRGSS